MRIENYKEGDCEQVLDLFELAFGKKLSKEFWQWRFENNPFGKHLIKLCWDDDKLAGHYAVSPIQFRLNEDIITSSLSMTTMTHPEYGGRGIFGSLASELYSMLSDELGHSFVYGFPNSNSHYGFVKNLGWKDICTIPTLTLNNFKKLKDNIGFSTNTDFDDLLWQEYKEDELKINKTKEYFKWRYTQNPVNNYLINSINNNLIVFKKFKSFSDPNKIEIDILELLCEPDFDLIQDLISTCIVDLDIKTLNSINTWIPLHDKKHILIEKIGFHLSSPITFLGLKAFKNEDLKINNFSFSMGDSDIY